MNNLEKNIFKYPAFFLLLFFALNSVAQIVTTNKNFPNGEIDITIIVDLKLSVANNSKTLLGKTSDIYLWSGAGDEENGNAFKYSPSGQSNFNAPFAPGKMTSLGNDIWSITLNPRKYYNVPVGIEIIKLGLVIKNGTGTAQTEDLELKLYNSNINLKIIDPTITPVISNISDKIPLKILFSTKVNVKLVLWENFNGGSGSYDFGNFNETDSLSTEINLSEINKYENGAQLNLNIITTTNNETVTTTILNFIQIMPKIELASAPAGTKNGLNYPSNNEVILLFFAPKKKFVYLLGEFNDWKKKSEYLLKKDPDSDLFWIKLDTLEVGKEYAYQFLVDGTLAIADPFAEKILDPDHDKFISNSVYPNIKAYPNGAKGIVSVLQTDQKLFDWKATNFSRPKQENLLIYELLIRDFTTEGSYNATIQKLPYLKNLGINAIELMPVSEFTANDSWGYNPTFYLAPDKAYGTKNDLKNFIDICHQNEIAVIIDIVLNQADDAFPYVKMYFDGLKPSKDSPFFNQSATHPFSVFHDFNHESSATQNLVDRVTAYWLEEYKIDGFRFDLSKGFTQHKNTDVTLWSNYDRSRIKIWKRIYDQIRKVDESAYVILEHFAANDEEQELSDYGMMLWGNGNEEYKKALKGKSNSIENLSHIIREWTKPNLVGYMESHDEERLMYDLQKNGPFLGNYLTKDLNNALERVKAAAAIFFFTQGPKMIWQFGELGYDISINENGRTGKKPIKWDYYEVPSRKKLYQTYVELIKLKQLIDLPNAKFKYNIDNKTRQTSIKNSDFDTYVIANLDLAAQTIHTEIEPGKYYDYFTGESIILADSYLYLNPGEFHVYTTKKFSAPEAGIVPWEAITKEQILSFELSISNIFLFPNPVKDEIQFEIDCKIGSKFSVEIIDAAGQTYDKNVNNNFIKDQIHKFDAKKLPSGIYFLKVETEGKLQTGKFFKE